MDSKISDILFTIILALIGIFFIIFGSTMYPDFNFLYMNSGESVNDFAKFFQKEVSLQGPEDLYKAIYSSPNGTLESKQYKIYIKI